MSTSCTLVKLVALLGLAVASLSASAVELRGFRGVMWGDDVAKLGKSELAYADGDVACYKRERENLLFGDAALQSVRYCFRQEGLVLVQLAAAGDGAALRHEFERGYGAPVQRSGTLLQWGNEWDAVSAEFSPSGSGALLRLRAQPQPQASAR